MRAQHPTATTDQGGGTPVATAVMAALGTVCGTVRTHALAQVTAYTAQAERAAVDPNASTETVHREQAAKWACIARENGAREHQITTAYQEGGHIIPTGD